MALKFNGTSTDFALRWYNTATGEVTSKAYDHDFLTEATFSRGILKTKPRQLTIHPDHVADKDGFWLNGYQADKDKRITFTTGVKDKLVISKNETDFIFCSTNQSFVSCYRLMNGTEEDLRRMARCEGIYIVYTTQENGEYNWCGKVYTHPKMSGRAFLFESSDKRNHTCGRPYGKVGFEIRDVLRRWLPNGLSVGWKLSDEQKELVCFEQDNFSREGITIHDRWDKVFNTNELYSDGIPLFIDGNLINDNIMHSRTQMEMLKARIERVKRDKNEPRKEYDF